MKTLDGFCGRHKLVLEILQMDNYDPALFTSPKKYSVHFKNCSVKQGKILVSERGFGNTIYMAKQDYARAITNKVLVLDLVGDDRKVMNVPSLECEDKCNIAELEKLRLYLISIDHAENRSEETLKIIKELINYLGFDDICKLTDFCLRIERSFVKKCWE